MLNPRELLDKLGEKNNIYWMVNAYVRPDHSFYDLFSLIEELKKNDLHIYRSFLDKEAIPLLYVIAEDYYENPNAYEKFELK